MHDIAGRTALVTGASRGIGRYIARALAQAQMNLVLAARSPADLEQAMQEVLAEGVKCTVVVADITDSKNLRTLVDQANREFGSIDVLVNNAGIEKISSYHKLKVEDIERIIRANLTGAMLVTRMVLPTMLERHCGHILNVSALAGKAPPPYFEPYAATKAGLIAFTESLRAEYHGSGVSASVICPGFVEAGIYQRVKVETGIPAPRWLGTSPPEAVTRAVIRAIKKDIPEIIVNPGPSRLLTTLAEISPSLADWVIRRFGVLDWFKNVTVAREGQIPEPGERS